MSSLAAIPFPPPNYEGDEQSNDSIIVNAPLEPQPLPIPSTRWYFDKDELSTTPSRRAGIDGDKELTYRQQSANYIQDMGQRLQVNQLCINTAIVYMHRFFMYHSFQQFQKNAISTASIFLAAKVEEQPRKLEYVIKIAHYCLYRDTVPAIDVKSEAYLAQSTELVSNENILLQTLGFDVSVDHPHTHVVKCCQLVRASKDLAQTSYFMATNSLHLTTMCLQYPPSVVACVCIHLACKWSNWEIPRSKEGKEWYYYVDGSVTPQQLESLTSEFLTIFNKSPSRLKKRILNLSNATSGGSGGSGGGAITNFPTHFTVDRNSSGAQTIKSRSRTPSPTNSHPKAPKPSVLPPHKHKPTHTAPPHPPPHFPNKSIPPPPGHPLKHPTQKAPYPHPSLPGQPPRPTGYRETISPARQNQPKHAQSYPNHPNGVHNANRYPPSHHPPPSASASQSRPHPSQMAAQHSHHGSSQKGGSGSQPQPPTHGHHPPAKAVPPPPQQSRQSLIKPHPPHPQAPPHKSQGHHSQPHQMKDPTKHPPYPHQLPPNGNHSSSTLPSGHINPRPQPQLSQSLHPLHQEQSNLSQSFPGTGVRSGAGSGEQGKKRPVDSSADDPSPKRPRQDGANLSNLTTLPLPSSDDRSLADMLKLPSVKVEHSGKVEGLEGKPSVLKTEISDEWGLERRSSHHVKTEPLASPPLPSLSITTTFPLLSSEMGLVAGPPSLPVPGFEGKMSPVGQEDPSGQPTAESPAASSSSHKKKKKKKEHKVKREKDEKSHRHRDKEEKKKSKKDKHRDRGEDGHRSKKTKKKDKELGISTVQDNSLKIKIVAPKEALDSKSKNGRNLQSNMVVYY